jgi:hypothetical protein
MFKILYKDGTPVQVPEDSVKDFLAKGYTKSLPIKKPVSQSPVEDSVKGVLAKGYTKSLPQKPVSQSPVETITLPQSERLNINKANLKDMVKLLKVSISNARNIAANRPYLSIEELKARNPGVELDDFLSIIYFEEEQSSDA